VKPYTSGTGLCNGEGQSCSEVSRNEIVKPTQDSLVPVKILHPSQLSTVIARGREQGPSLGCDERGFDLSLGGCSSSEHPTWEHQWEKGGWGAVAICILVRFWWY